MKRSLLYGCLALAVCIGACVGSAAAGDKAKEIPTWTKQGVLTGATVTEADCTRSDRIWVDDKDGGVCIRFFTNGAKPRDGIGILIFDGDFVGSDWDENGFPVRAKIVAGYDSKAELRRAMSLPRNWKRDLVILIGRPGQLGSSGDHKEKYKRKESRVINVAIDQIKAKFGLSALVLAGHSGGATLVANLLAKRIDLKCIAMNSGAVSLHDYASDVGFNPTVWAAWEDPILSVGKIKPSTAEYYVLAGLGDQIRPPKYQDAFYRALKTSGLNAHFLLLRKPSDPHDLQLEGIRVAVDCAQGLSFEQIKRKLPAIRAD
jgi:predicted esterase